LIRASINLRKSFFEKMDHRVEPGDDGSLWYRRVGKANESRECAPDDKLRVPTISRIMVGTAQARLCPPYDLIFLAV
jgi:hypothetical protein